MASIRKRVRKDGTPSWQVMWRAEDNTQSSVTFLTEPEARTLCAALKANGGNFTIAQNVIAPDTGRHTVATVAREHIDMLTKPTDGTFDGYEGYLRNHIMDTIGGIPIEELTPAQVAAWVKGLSKKATGREGRTMAPKTVEHIHTFLSSTLKTAVRLKYRADNPAQFVDLPSAERADDDVMFFTLKEFSTLRECTDADYQTFVTFLVMTGLRFSEATAMTVGGVNLDASPANVRVTRAWKASRNRGVHIGPPKSRASKRTVSIPESLVKLLRPLVEGRSTEELLFPAPGGGRISYARFRRTHWEPAIVGMRTADRTFGKKPTPHVLRHTHASWLIQQGVEPFKVARRLGHSSTAMVEMVYGHLMPEAQADSASAIGRAMMGETAALGRLAIDEC